MRVIKSACFHLIRWSVSLRGSFMIHYAETVCAAPHLKPVPDLNCLWTTKIQSQMTWLITLCFQVGKMYANTQTTTVIWSIWKPVVPQDASSSDFSIWWELISAWWKSAWFRGLSVRSFCLSLPRVCFGHRQSCEMSCRVSYGGRMTHTFIWLCVPPLILYWTFYLRHSSELPHIQLGFFSVCVRACVCVRVCVSALLIFITAIKVCWRSTKSGRLGSSLILKQIDRAEQVEERCCSAVPMRWRHKRGNSFLQIMCFNLIGWISMLFISIFLDVHIPGNTSCFDTEGVCLQKKSYILYYFNVIS